MRVLRVLLCALFGHKMEKMPWWVADTTPAVWHLGHKDHDYMYSLVMCRRCNAVYYVKEKLPPQPKKPDGRIADLRP